jgi:hypothetical protein
MKYVISASLVKCVRICYVWQSVLTTLFILSYPYAIKLIIANATLSL